jgi:hypothetical protein
MTRACGADDIKNILHPALFRKLRFQMIDDIMNARASRTTCIQACHLRRDAALIEKDQPVQVDPANHLDELFAPLAVLFRVTFLGVE